MRREWIEIFRQRFSARQIESPSIRREWIEMPPVLQAALPVRSPSIRREWIEITSQIRLENVSHMVSLHTEGVD